MGIWFLTIKEGLIRPEMADPPDQGIILDMYKQFLTGFLFLLNKSKRWITQKKQLAENTKIADINRQIQSQQVIKSPFHQIQLPRSQ